jgi:fructose-bisphosphate aldolase class II
MLIPLREALELAQRSGCAVGAFNAVSLEQIEAVVAGAEHAGTLVVLQISENAVRSHGALLPIGAAALAVARSSSVSVVVHLDHASDLDLVDQAIELGFTSVMFDGSRLPHDANVAATRTVVRQARLRGVSVEAELGEIGGKDGVHSPTARTAPDDARRFVDATEVDALAVAIGSSHAMTVRDAVLDLDLLAALRAAVDVPLVLHGSSGVADEEIARAVHAGITKVNIATHVSGVFTETARRVLQDHIDLVDARRFLIPAREAMAREVARLLGVVSTPGRSTEAIASNR